MDSQFIADWSCSSSSSMVGDAFAPLLGGGEDDGLVELLWCNGHVVLQNQLVPRNKAPLPRPAGKAAAVAVAVVEEVHEAAPWSFQYPDGESSLLEKDLFSEMFGGMVEPVDAGRVWKAAAEEERSAVVTTFGGSELMPLPLPPPPREKTGWGCGASEGVAAVMTDAGGESSSSLLTTIGSTSVCGSNGHVHAPRVVFSDTTTAGDSTTSQSPPLLGYGTSSFPACRSSHHDASTTVTSSSMRSSPPCPGSGAASGKRRKQSDSTDHHHQPAESLSEDAEYESAAATMHEPAASKPTSTSKRRRAAEVHNLSERRRRDRINEKMKALQELIPHCNKTDKASMLDEAIEYLKSLQMQVQLQMMWTGGGAMASTAAAAPTPMTMFPVAGVHHQYMQRMASMPFMPTTAPQSSPVSQLPAADTHARYLAVPPPSPMHYMQGMMSFYQLGAAKNPQQNPTPVPLPLPVVPGGNHTGAAAS